MIRLDGCVPMQFSPWSSQKRPEMASQPSGDINFWAYSWRQFRIDSAWVFSSMFEKLYYMEQLIPVAWKTTWAPMQPFLLE